MKIKKICCYIFVLVLVFNTPISAYAQSSATTPTVTIAAGTGAAVGGAYQGYTSKTAAAATALTLAVLSATGAAVKLTEASVQAGKTVYQVINDKFAKWVGGTSAEELTPSQAEELQSRFKVITGGGDNSEDPDNDQNHGTNIGEDGKLWFSPGSLAMLEKFTSWLESQNEINQLPQQDETLPTVNLGSYSTVMATKAAGTYNNGTWTCIEAPEPCACVIINNSYILMISNKQMLLEIYEHRGNNFDVKMNIQNRYFSERNGIYYSKIYGPFGGWGSFIPDGMARLNSENEALDITEWQESQGSNGSIENDGIYANTDWNNDLLRNPNNQVLVVDPGILNGFNVDSDRQIAIPDYIDLIIQQAEERAKREAQPEQSPVPQELPVPLIDPIAGTKSPANWIDPAPEDAIQDPIESEKRDPDPEDPKDPVIDDETPTDPEDAIELMKVDLTRIFPFCIPWDLYRLFTKFNADPVTPSITIDWGDILGAFGIDYVSTLDLHDYDNVASILRTMETVAFVVGLAVATRSIFLRS